MALSRSLPAIVYTDGASDIVVNYPAPAFNAGELERRHNPDVRWSNLQGFDHPLQPVILGMFVDLKTQTPHEGQHIAVAAQHFAFYRR